MVPISKRATKRNIIIIHTLNFGKIYNKILSPIDKAWNFLHLYNIIYS